MQRYLCFYISAFFVFLFAFGIPLEHKYDKIFRFFSETLIPKDLILPPWFDYKIYFYISDIAAIILSGLSLFFFKLPFRNFFFDKGSFFLWIIFFSAIFSIIYSPIYSYPIPYIRLIQLLTPILLYCFLSQNFSSEEKTKLTQIFMGTLFIIASFEATIAIAQYWKQDFLGLRMLGELKPTASFHHFNTNRWTLDYLFPRLTENTELFRSSGTFPHTNVLGGFLCISLLASYSWIATSKKKILFFFPFVMQFFAMSLTFSRAAFFSWILGTCIWIGYLTIHQGIKKSLSDPTLRFMAFTITFSLIFTSALLYEQIFSRGGIITYNQLAQNSDKGRIEYQNIALKMIQHKPLTGVGYSQFTLRLPEYLPPSTDSKKMISGSHNIYFFLGAETGLISLISFLCFIFFLLKSALRTPFSYQINSLLSIFIAFLLIGTVDFYPILFQQGKLLFFGLAGLLSAQSHTYKPFFLRQYDHTFSK